MSLAECALEILSEIRGHLNRIAQKLEHIAKVLEENLGPQE
jgi:hypothetical protein